MLRNGDLRKRVCNRAILEFCSLLGMNLADMQVEDGGRFVGNGWERCNLFGMALKGVTVEMDRFQGCSMGSTDFQDVRLEDVRFCDCSFSGSVWTETVLEGGVFQNCIFRGMGNQGYQRSRKGGYGCGGFYRGSYDLPDSKYCQNR